MGWLENPITCRIGHLDDSDDWTSGFFGVKEAYDFHLNAKQIIKESDF